MKPLADRIRPTTLEEVVGQEHILGKGKLLYNMLQNGHVMNMIFYGPPGVGKTTVANIIAKNTKKKLYKLNATNASIKDIQQITQSLNTLMGYQGVVLYLDEIQNFNRKQQQSLLEYIEDGRITLIASTADNPYHYIYNAILSRSMVFEFNAISKEDIRKALERALQILKQENYTTTIEVEEEVLDYLAVMSGGDIRRALNDLEALVFSTTSDQSHKYISIEKAKENITVKGFQFDQGGDQYYDALSALQKSIRGSDPDASIHYAARLIKGGQLLAICRRLLVIASEDIGLAYPQASSIVYALVKSALQIGLPEARIPIAQAVLLLATSPKSNTAYLAMDAALQDIENKEIGEIPLHLRDTHYSGAQNLNRIGYKYPHDYPNHYIKQQYLPDALLGTTYYTASNNKMEKAIQTYLDGLKA